MTSENVADRYGVVGATVRKWAAVNGVAYIGEGRRKTYQWTEEDCQRFEQRESPGWKKGRSRVAGDHADNLSNTEPME